MPPSPVYAAFSKTSCTRVSLSTSLKITNAVIAKIKRLTKDQSEREWWFAKTYAGGQSLKIGNSILLKGAAKNDFSLTIRWFLTEEDPPPTMGDSDSFIEVVRASFGEREVDVLVWFVFHKEKHASVFKPFDVGEPSQIFDEIVGFSGIKKDPEGKLLYRMEIEVTPATIEHKLSFRQTVQLSDDMVIPVLETGSKISALAIKPIES